MLALSAGLLLAVSQARIDADADRVRKLFESDHYNVEWAAVPIFPADAELEIGDGNGHGGSLDWVRLKPAYGQRAVAFGAGHGGSLDWVRLKPGRDGVDVLSVQFDPGWKPYRSKWPPDRAPVTVTSTRMTVDGYAALLRDLAVVASARTKRAGGLNVSSLDYWVAARLAADRRVLLDLDWVGYWTHQSEYLAAKPTTAVRLVRQAVESLKLEKHTLTADDRAWASVRFARDWKRYKGQKDYWWVADRSITTVGVVGDDKALATLRDILSDPADELGRQHYHAINAVTRLTGQDVRTKLVEEMDIEKVRPKVLELLKGKK